MTVIDRVIASAAKQPRGLTLTCGDVPLGCFGVLHLPMTRVKQDPLPRPRRCFPQRGKWPEGPKGALLSLFRIPREGGAPAPFTPPDRSGHILVLRRAQDEDEWVGSGCNPLTQPSPPQGGEGLSVISPLPEGEGWVRAFLILLNKSLTPAAPKAM